ERAIRQRVVQRLEATAQQPVLMSERAESQVRNLQPARDPPGDGQGRCERQDHQVAELEIGAGVLEALRACGQPLLYGIADQHDMVAAEDTFDRTDSA